MHRFIKARVPDFNEIFIFMSLAKINISIKTAGLILHRRFSCEIIENKMVPDMQF